MPMGRNLVLVVSAAAGREFRDLTRLMDALHAVEHLDAPVIIGVDLGSEELATGADDVIDAAVLRPLRAAVEAELAARAGERMAARERAVVTMMRAVSPRMERQVDNTAPRSPLKRFRKGSKR